MAMWIRRPPSKKQLMMWGVILGFSLLLAGLAKYNMWPEIWNLNRHPNKVQMAPMN
jgi:hypothetical protein